MKLRNYNGNLARNLIFVGDSYQVGNYSGASFTSFVTLFNERYSSEFGDIYHVEQGSYGFAANGTLLFLTLLKRLESEIEDKESITDIIVTGGYNDWQNPAGVGNGIRDFMDYCRETYPNAEVWLAPVAALRSNNAEKAYNAMVNWKTEGAKYGANVIQGIETCLRCGKYLISDNVHPNQAGQDVLCNALYTGIRTGSYNHYENSSSANFKIDTAFNGNSNTIYTDQHGSNCTIMLTRGMWLTLKSAKKINANGETFICIGSIYNACTFGQNFTTQFALGVNMNVLMRYAAGKYKNVNCVLSIHKGKLYITPFAVEDGAQYKDFSADAIILPPFRLTVDNTRG